MAKKKEMAKPKREPKPKPISANPGAALSLIGRARKARKP